MADEDPWGTDDTEDIPPTAPSSKASSKATPKTGTGTGTPSKSSKTPSKTGTGTVPSKTGSKEGSRRGSKAGSKAGTPGIPGTPGELPEGEVPPQEDKNARRPITLYRHWVRPQFLQYSYMYDYRTNYYNDVINYLDKRSRGVKTEVPRAQTWAERVLRTHTNESALDRYKSEKKEEKHLIQTIAATIRTHNYHTTAYINQKYARVL